MNNSEIWSYLNRDKYECLSVLRIRVGPPLSNYAVIGGGNYKADGGIKKNSIDYISISTLGNSQDFGGLSDRKDRLSATSNGSNNRGIFSGGEIAAGAINTIEYVTINSPSNTIDFGDLTVNRYLHSSCSNDSNDRGVFAGSGSNDQTIDYITISSTGNASFFGYLSFVEPTKNRAATSNSTNDRGIFAGGGTTDNDYISYITISSAGNSSEFGNLTDPLICLSATSNGTDDRGVFGGGAVYNYIEYNKCNIIQYITISSTGDASDFGDLTYGRYYLSASSNGTSNTGVFIGGHDDFTNTIEYITISNTGNASIFGNLPSGMKLLHDSTDNAG